MQLSKGYQDNAWEAYEVNAFCKLFLVNSVLGKYYPRTLMYNVANLLIWLKIGTF